MRNQQVLVQIGKIDEFLKQEGVRDFCIACINGPKGGCCQHCDLLGTSGCTNKPLSCTLWICDDVRRKFKHVQEQLNIIQRQWPAQVAYGYRHESLRAEEQL